MEKDICANKEQRWLGIFIAGSTNLAPGEFHRLLAKLTSNYDACSVYQVGDPSGYVNSLVRDWAFQNNFPIRFGEEGSDEDGMTQRFSHEDNKAVILFDSKAWKTRKQVRETARRFAAVPGTQFKTIAR